MEWGKVGYYVNSIASISTEEGIAQGVGEEGLTGVAE